MYFSVSKQVVNSN